MSRSIPQWLSGVVEALELERPQLVSTPRLESICREQGVGAPARVVAARLRERGWLLATPQRGVWEFAPAEAAGAYSSNDPLIPLKAFRLAHAGAECALTFHAAAWALGASDRAPGVLDVAFAQRPSAKLPGRIAASTFRSSLAKRESRGAPVLAPEAGIVHMAHRPAAVRSWEGALEWLPELAFEAEPSAVLEELGGRPASTWARAGYLMQGMRPDIARAIRERFAPSGKVRLSREGAALRNDERWMVSDSLLPFDPRDLEAVR